MAPEQPSEREPAPAGRAVDEDGLLGVGGAAGVKTAGWSSQRGDCAPVPTNYRHQPPPEPAVGRLMPDPLSLAHGRATKPSIFQLPIPISPLAHASIASSTRGTSLPRPSFTRAGLGRQPRPALGPATRQDAPPGTSSHARAESVISLTATPAGLKGSFHEWVGVGVCRL
jgi:hypothetical protein